MLMQRAMDVSAALWGCLVVFLCALSHLRPAAYQRHKIPLLLLWRVVLNPLAVTLFVAFPVGLPQRSFTLDIVVNALIMAVLELPYRWNLAYVLVNAVMLGGQEALSQAPLSMPAALRLLARWPRLPLAGAQPPLPLLPPAPFLVQNMCVETCCYRLSVECVRVVRRTCRWPSMQLADSADFRPCRSFAAAGVLVVTVIEFGWPKSGDRDPKGERETLFRQPIARQWDMRLMRMPAAFLAPPKLRTPSTC